ncbi:hypothetical protein N7517_000829 [Penicillium concentricum]|uniref:Uncharacterized protein n=1 Tax=Penicillium concentricum TaxID=293559 RepID=A0A9W9SUS7_9EURO|nr:uncharacterized protein N7517_000829 [Penicillium concentricum]KAJ5382918.1 hypothetical protein N7517_000829 [Penicillium concentricum]
MLYIVYSPYGVYGYDKQNMKIEHSIVSSGTKSPLSPPQFYDRSLGERAEFKCCTLTILPCPIKARRRSTGRFARHSDQRVGRHVTSTGQAPRY